MPLNLTSLTKVFPHPGTGQTKSLCAVVRLSLDSPVVVVKLGLVIIMEVGLPRPVLEGTEKFCRLGMNGRGSQLRDGEPSGLG